MGAKLTTIAKTRWFHDEYQLGDVIGSGAFATVRECKHRKSRKLYAVKVFDLDTMKPKDVAALTQEADLMTKLNHPNIVKIIDFFKEKKHAYLVLEYMEGGSLFEIIEDKGRIRESQAKRYMTTLVKAIQFCHSMNVVHRDIKPENVLLSSNGLDAEAKLADFGLSTDQDILKTTCGTSCYLAPEIVKRLSYGKPCDMWAIGVTLYCMLVGYSPFDNENDRLMYRNIKNGTYTFDPKDWEFISPDAKDLISKLLVIDPNARLTSEEVLRHPWFQDKPKQIQESQLLTNESSSLRLSFKKIISGGLYDIIN